MTLTLLLLASLAIGFSTTCVTHMITISLSLVTNLISFILSPASFRKRLLDLLTFLQNAPVLLVQVLEVSLGLFLIHFFIFAAIKFKLLGQLVLQWLPLLLLFILQEQPVPILRRFRASMFTLGISLPSSLIPVGAQTLEFVVSIRSFVLLLELTLLTFDVIMVVINNSNIFFLFLLHTHLD